VSLVAGIGLASATGELPGLVLLAVTVFALYIGGRLALIAYATRSPAQLQRLLALPHRILARFDVGGGADAPFEKVAEDAFNAVSSLRRRPSSVRGCTWPVPRPARRSSANT